MEEHKTLTRRCMWRIRDAGEDAQDGEAGVY
jgi:hypothetical protein